MTTESVSVVVSPLIIKIKDDIRRAWSQKKSKGFKYLIMMRGPSGCGKSTTAKWFAEQFPSKVEIYSTDDSFMVDGVYTFDKTKLSKYHELNKLRARDAMVRQTPIVIIDNTNIVEEHYLPYVRDADSCKYRIIHISAEMIRSEIISPETLAQLCKAENLNPSRGKSVPDIAIDRQVVDYYRIGMMIKT